MELLGVVAVLLLVGLAVALSKGSSSKKEPPQAIKPKPADPAGGSSKLVARRPPKAAAKRAEETGKLDYSSTVGPVTDDTGVPDYGSNGGMSFMRAGAVKRAHEAVGPLPYVPPPQIRGRTHTKVVDVAGTWTRAVTGGDFDHVIERLPMGPVWVTMRLEPNDANPYGISAYVDGAQVGYLATKWTKDDTSVRFMTRLDEAGILPRFQGLHKVEQGDRHIINFDYPGKNDGRLGDISRRIIKEQSGATG